jgi:maleamate amidohydrolase
MQATEIHKKQNLGNRVGFGTRPALLIVDFVNGFNDAEVLGGGNIDAAIHQTQSVLQEARGLELPIVFTRIVYEPNGANAGAFAKKIPALVNLTEDVQASQIVPQLAPLPGEHIIRKTQASAFFGTDLAPWLTWRGVDTLLVTGCTTSGCVRASVIDAASHNLRAIVIRDCVGDRALEPHEANLFDMDAKYGDVVPKPAVMKFLSSLARNSAA